MAASKNLSKKEIEILSILAHAENPMTISDIVATNSAYTTNIVQPIIHKLSDLGLVEVDYIAFPDELTQEGMEAILPDSMENGENQGDAGNAGAMNVME